MINFLLTGLRAVSSWLFASETGTGLLLAIATGLLAGLGAVTFAWLIQVFQSLFFGGGGQALSFLGQYYVILMPLAGGLIVGPFLYFLAREAKGHGVPEVMESVATKGGRIPPRVVPAKALASAITIGSGGSAGRVGPIVHIGASLGSAIGQWSRLPDEHVKTLVACGAAGGIAATFNAPIAGVIFALEVIMGRVVTKRFTYVVISAVTADLIARAFLGNHYAFAIPEFGIVSAWEVPLYVVLGILSALVSVTFIWALHRSGDFFESLKMPGYLKPALGGLIVGLLGLSNIEIYGDGFDTIGRVLSGQLAFQSLLVLWAIKIAATSVTIGSGGSGGVFAPGLFIGAMLGAALGSVFHSLFPAVTAPPEAYGVVGMAAVFAGTARAPLTAILIIIEMTGDYAIILPLMTAVVISTGLARGLKRESIYTIKLLRRGIDLGQEEFTDIMRTISVKDVMTRNFTTVKAGMGLEALLELFRKTGHHGFPVVDEEGNLSGIVTLTDVERSLGKSADSLTVADIATRSPYVVYPDQTLDRVLRAAEDEYGRIPVVSREDRRKLVGVLQRRDIIRAYRSRARKT